MTKTSIV